MPEVTVYNCQGKKTGTAELSEAVFGVKANDTLLHQVFVALSANRRSAIAHTKDRSERAGSGKKPWKQKGTGRARAGSVRSPLWRKGGIVFGPTNERNFSQKVNQKMRRKAVTIALSEKVRLGKLMIVEAFDFPEKKTKLFAQSMEALKMDTKSVLVGLTGAEKSWEIMMRNVERKYFSLTADLNVYDLLNREYLLLTREGVKELEARLALEKVSE